MKKYTIEVTEEQLKLISNACELSSRLRSGQFHELRYIFQDLAELTERKPNYDEEENVINAIKRLFNLDQGESISISGSGQIARELYEIYYMIKHYFAEGISVYKYNLMEVTNEPKISIKEIK